MTSRPARPVSTVAAVPGGIWLLLIRATLVPEDQPERLSQVLTEFMAGTGAAPAA
jgi:hypothetical protein